MIHALFKNNKMVGYAIVEYSSSDEEEKIVPILETELVKLVGENWKKDYSKLTLIDGKIEVNETLTPPVS